jgi:hypothetical protein
LNRELDLVLAASVRILGAEERGREKVDLNPEAKDPIGRSRVDDEFVVGKADSVEGGRRGWGSGKKKKKKGRRVRHSVG